MVDDGVSRIELTPSLDDLAVARRFVRERLEGAPREVVDDVQIIASELVTNAVEHGPKGPITVAVDQGPSMVTLLVASSSPDQRIPPADSWRIADVGAITGRGLGIVRRLADEVSVDQTETTLSITAKRSY